MNFKQFCQEMYYRYVDECWDCQGFEFIKSSEEYWAENKWFVKKQYRKEHGRLQRDVLFSEYVYPGGDCQI